MKYPTVTEILDATMSPQKRASLQAWKDRIGHEAAEEIRQAAMARGNKIDEQVEVFQDTGSCEDQRIAEYLTGYKFLERELRVQSDMHQYRGRLDAILQMNERNILVDFKGSTKWKPVKFLSDYRLQLGAYFGALRETGYHIDCGCVVLFVDGRDRPQIYWQQLHELDEAHLEFVEKVKEYERMKAEL